MRDESLCGCSCHAVTQGQYIRLCLPVFLINSKWNCKQMKQFYTKCILSESLLCYSEKPSYHGHMHYCPMHSQAKVHKSWFGCLQGYCYRSKPILEVFYMFVFFLSDDKSDVISHTWGRPFPLPVFSPLTHKGRFTHAVHGSLGMRIHNIWTHKDELYESRFCLSHSSFPCHSIAPCQLMHAFYGRCRKVECQFPFKMVKEV